EIFDRGRVDLVILAEDEAASECCLAIGHRPAEGCVGAGANLGAMGEGQRQDGEHAQDQERCGTSTLHRRQGWRRARSDSIGAGPMPLPWSGCSTEESPPCCSRNWTMSWAVTGPMPSIVSSCSTVAVPRLIGPSSAAPPVTARDAPPGPRWGTTTC